MKKTFIVPAILLLASTLIGCNGNKTEVKLPDGGVKLDLKKAEDAEKAKLSIKNSALKTVEKLNKFKITSNLEELNLDLPFTASIPDFGDVQGRVEAKGNGKAIAQINGLAGKFKDVKGRAAVEANFSTNVSATIPFYTPTGTPITKDLSLKLSGNNLRAEGYMHGKKLYANFSDNSIRSLLTDANTKVNDLLTDLGMGMLIPSIPDLNLLLDQYTDPSRKIQMPLPGKDLPGDDDVLLNEEFINMITPEVEEFANGVVTTLSGIESDIFEARKYEDGKFGIMFDVTLDKLSTLLPSTVALSMFNRLNVKAALVTNSDLTIDTLNIAADVDFTLQTGEFTIQPKLNLTLANKVTYNEDFDLPTDLDSYKLLA